MWCSSRFMAILCVLLFGTGSSASQPFNDPRLSLFATSSLCTLVSCTLFSRAGGLLNLVLYGETCHKSYYFILGRNEIVTSFNSAYKISRSLVRVLIWCQISWIKYSIVEHLLNFRSIIGRRMVSRSCPGNFKILSLSLSQVMPKSERLHSS